MSYYSLTNELPGFNDTLPVSKTMENVVANYLIERGWGFVGRNTREDFRYDIIMKNARREYKFELKEDFACEKYGNVAVEYECRGKPSGISNTEAELYFYKIHSPTGIIYHVCSVEQIKKFIEEKKYHRIANGGDIGSNTMMYLFRLSVFLSMPKCAIIRDDRIK